MSKVAVVLSGCGYLDGAEIHESVLSMYHLEKAGHIVKCFAPDMEQAKVLNHLTKSEFKTEKRNVLLESARIARGKIDSLKSLSFEKFDALFIPGGFGAALNLSNFAQNGENCTVHSEMKRVIIEFFNAKRPIAATCISPVLLASVFKELKVKVKMTLGSDDKNKLMLDKMGMVGVINKVDEFTVDKEHRVYTTPCYMEPDDLVGVGEGIESLIKDFL